ncbi:MAG: glycerophosphodiester phosphodiesterase family protein [Porticoccaceae bacterium]|nr:glycerophosphodiester phosphodiesterase family protein [Porticoccaceae bacterium]|tara:strand:+ start:52 stop:819 length:768 start_codon:yes stop_codon:yes gene_type:complete
MSVIILPVTPLNAEELVAHRGYRAKYPENTALSINKAIDAGALYVELDVQFSQDKLPIIYHDTTLSRVSGSDKSVFAFKRDELLVYPAYEPERLGDTFIAEKISPLESLVAILEANPDVKAFVELKDESIDHCGRELMLESVQQILQPVADRAVIMSFDYSLALGARKSGWPLVGLVLKQWDDLYLEEVKAAEPDFIYTDHLIIPPKCDLAAIEVLRDATLVAYEVGSQALGHSLLGRGVDMLETFEIEAMLITD